MSEDKPSLKYFFDEVGLIGYVIHMTLGMAIALVIASIFTDMSNVFINIEFVYNIFNSAANGIYKAIDMCADLLIDVTLITSIITISQRSIPIIDKISKFIFTGTNMIIEKMKEEQEDESA